MYEYFAAVSDGDLNCFYQFQTWLSSLVICCQFTKRPCRDAGCACASHYLLPTKWGRPKSKSIYEPA